MVRLKKIDRRAWMTSLSHLIVICIIFLLPVLLVDYTRPGHHNHHVMMYVKAAIYVVAFYFEYYVVIGSTLLKGHRHIIRFLVYNLAAIVVLMGVMYLMQKLLYNPDRFQDHRHEMAHREMVLLSASFVLRELGMLVLTMALAVAMRLASNWNTLERKHQEVLATQRADELRNLKSQLNPHFLFNTLNTIYSLIEISPKEAQSAVHRLSKLLRYVLYENPATVSLASEVEFVSSYVSLMRMRIGDDAVKTDFAGIADPSVQVPPLLFIPLVENAFKHGYTGRIDQPVEFAITQYGDGRLKFRAFNYFLPESDGEGPRDESRSGGIGIANLERRIHLIYGNDAALEIEKTENTYTATLTINTSAAK